MVQAHIGSQYKFIEGKAESETVFSVDSEGSIASKGNIRSDGDVTVKGEVNVHGGLVFDRQVVEVGETGEGEINALGNAFIEIDGKGGVAAGNNNKNKNIRLKFGDSKPKPGQLLIVKNGQPSNAVITNVGSNGKKLDVPGETLIMFMFTEPEGWMDVTAAAAHTRNIKGVKGLSADNDLDIGKFSLTAGRFVGSDMAGLELSEEGQIAYFGPGGVIVSNLGVRFDKGTSTFKVKKIQVGEFSGDIDFKGGAIKNAAIVDATIEGVKHLNVER